MLFILLVNPRCPNMVKIGMSIDSAEIRLNSANKRNEWMCGRWIITQKVKTNDVRRTETLSHGKYLANFTVKKVFRQRCIVFRQLGV